MANNVSFIIELQDRFSNAAKKINTQFRALNSNAIRASATLKNKFGKTVTRSTALLKKMGRGALRTSRFIGGNLVKGIQKLRSVATGAFVVIAAAAALAFRKMLFSGADFQDSLADLSAITGLSGEGLKKLSTDILRLAKDSVTSASDVATAFKLIASAKPELLENIPALKNMTKEVLLLKNAAGIELAEAADIAAKGLNIFRLGADQASRVVNVLAAGAKFGSSEIRDTGEAMKLAGPQAVAAGLSFEQLNAAIQAVAKGGIKGAQAGTALSAILGRLRREGVGAGEGLDIKKLGLPRAFELVSEALDRTTNATARAQLEAKIFGEEHAKVGLALLGNIGFLKKVEQQIRGTNVAQEQANIRMNTFNTRVRKLGIIINEALIKTFVRLESVLTKQVGDLKKWFEALNEQDIKDFADALKGLLTVASALGKAIAFIGKGFKIVGSFIGEGLAKEVEFFKEIASGTRGEGIEKRRQVEALRNTNISENLNVLQQPANKSSIVGEIVVRATQGTKVESSKLQTRGNGLSVGMNVVTDGI